MSVDFRIRKNLSLTMTEPMLIPGANTSCEGDSPEGVSSKKAKCLLNACVIAAPAMAGSAMYEVKLAYNNNKQTSMYKSKQDFFNLKSMFQLLAITSAKGCCQLCQECSQDPCISMDVSCRGDNASDILDLFLSCLISKLQSVDRRVISDCSCHMGVVKIMTDFLELRNVMYFTSKSDENLYADDDAPLSVSHCSLSKSLSEHFSSFDSVC
ncbi:hypothetical protein DYB25_002463 [Aphanomyces astaci]|uniref:Uncharacterized protein n=2 Tax=Aphanomyces astaci TaxID=112090 RepID=A0A397ASH2_APHAT|nr:hypothetical protein DYB36_000119 [Aphanomyces astaci]RHY19180.1 hypothetical protein DYB25_002463 [Aphanomyces astaci]RHY50659.1 hypothetical protein DYB34_002600 [Aphanomyces astaci]RHY67366.1 hypothetical protein DYB30_000797 [Aphanomyces astaci]RHY75981.1 hypothetical protein DYB38_002106 [Aphanomyces astaci]